MTLPYSERYRYALYDCGIRYRAMCDDPVLAEFIEQFIKAVPILSLHKLNCWLGFIQGTLIAREITTIEAERNWARPLFQSLDDEE